MPQEVELWYLIPALRGKIAKILVKDYDLSQVEIAKILKITESAVSQYLKEKRGNELKFTEKEIESIREIVGHIYSKKLDANQEIYKLCVKFRGCDSLCNFHKTKDKSLPKDCDICVC